MKRSDFTSARNFFELELNEAKQTGDKHREGAAYTNLGNAYRFLGDYKKAIEFHQQSLSIAKGIGEKGSEGTAYTLALRITVSVLIKKQSNFISSLLVSQKRLEKKVSKGQQYPNLGTVYDSLGNYKKQSNFISSLLVSQKR